MKNCIDCGSGEIAERRRCKECAKEYNRQRAKKRYREKGRYNYGKGVCSVCKQEMILWKRDQVTHVGCRHKIVEDYNKIPRKNGNVRIRETLQQNGINIPNGYVVHHVDENPYNNKPENLWLMSRGAHNSLHRKLQFQRSLWLKNHNSNDENCWEVIRDHITTAWLETTSANVIKICDIWQSAAELLNQGYEEGSETMHVTPKS